MAPYYVIAISILLQCLAMVLALRLIRVTGRVTAWVIMAMAISLMAARRLSTLYSWISESLHSFPASELATEVIALISSSLMVTGLLLIAPLFLTLQQLSQEKLNRSEEKYQLLAANVPAVVFKGYSDGTVDFCDDKVTELLGYPRQDFNSRSLKWLDIIASEDQPGASEIFIEALKTGKSYVREYRVKHCQGQMIWVEERSQIVCNDAGEIDYISGVFFDISIRMQAKEALKHSQEEMSSWVKRLEQRNHELTLLSEMGDMLQSCLNYEETHTVIGKFLKEIFSEQSGALIIIEGNANMLKAVAVWGESPGEELEAFPPEECWAMRTGRILGTKEHHLGLCRHPKASVILPSLCLPLIAQGEALGVLRIADSNTPTTLTESKKNLAVNVAEHISLALANLRLRETLHHQSIQDPLTGLNNRRFMDEALEREVYRAGRYQRPLGIILIDIDYFKRFNDTFGHDAGDYILTELGHFLLGKLRQTDLACRYGGEEFLLIMPDIDPENLVQRADILRELFKNMNFVYQGRPLGPVTLSLGVASMPEQGLTAKELLQAADQALYHAKDEGRDRVTMGPSRLPHGETIQPCLSAREV
jgi:diguanylate cyclase (GGDEF)-like protein/PAS domain S-box-containing protein